MKLILQLFGLFLILAGISIFISPNFIFDLITVRLETKGIYYAAIGARLFLGSILLVVASQAKFPIAIRVLGGISILAAVIFIFMGQQRFIKLLSNLLPTFQPYAWVSGLLSIGFGGFLIYAFKVKK